MRSKGYSEVHPWIWMGYVSYELAIFEANLGPRSGQFSPSFVWFGAVGRLKSAGRHKTMLAIPEISGRQNGSVQS